MVLAGGGGGAVPTGRHLRFGDDPPLGNLYTSMLQAVGVDVASFGDDGTGPLDGLT